MSYGTSFDGHFYLVASHFSCYFKLYCYCLFNFGK